MSLDEKTGAVHPVLEEIVQKLPWVHIAVVTALSVLTAIGIVLLVLVVS
jgi:hypothetical protein